MWGHLEKMANYDLGSRTLPDSESGATLILDFSASKTLRNKFLLLSHPVCGYIGTQMDEDKSLMCNIDRFLFKLQFSL